MSSIDIMFSTQLDFANNLILTMRFYCPPFDFSPIFLFFHSGDVWSKLANLFRFFQTANHTKSANIHFVSLTSHKYILHNIQYIRETLKRVIRAHLREKDVKICWYLFYNRFVRKQNKLNIVSDFYGEEKRFLVIYQLLVAVASLDLQ